MDSDKEKFGIRQVLISCCNMLRDKAFEKLLENDLKFPNFPWINLENLMKSAIEHHQIYSLATCRLLIDKKQSRFFKNPCPEKCFGYNYSVECVDFDNALFLQNLWDVLKNYAQLYFIYFMQTSMLVSNYSIRDDMILEDLGNFPIWDSDFFERDSRLLDSFSRHSHILDFDSLRLGRKLVKDNKFGSAFEFGVVALTEIGKERGNSLENQELKKKSDETNQKNDKFDDYLKMAGHLATVDNFTFLFIVADEQRSMSWGANARELCDIVNIAKRSDIRLAMPFFGIENFVIDWVLDVFKRIYLKFRYLRSDNTLFMYSIKTLCSKLWSYKQKIYNRFGYQLVDVECQNGSIDSDLKKCKYYYMTKKIYSKRFRTDAFNDFFNERALRSAYGINDLPSYASEKASFDELEKQNSYFINSLINGILNSHSDDLNSN